MTVLHGGRALVKWSQYYIGEGLGAKHQIHDQCQNTICYLVPLGLIRQGRQPVVLAEEDGGNAPVGKASFSNFLNKSPIVTFTISPWVCKVRLRKNLFAANFVMSFDTAQKQKRGLFKCLQVSTVRHCGSKVLYNSLHPEISKSSQSNPTTSATSICDGVLLLLFQKSKFSTLLKKLSFAEERCKMRPCQGRRSRWRWWGRWPWWRWVSGCRCLCPENHVKTHRILGRYVIYVIWYTYMIYIYDMSYDLPSFPEFIFVHLWGQLQTQALGLPTTCNLIYVLIRSQQKKITAKTLG